MERVRESAAQPQGEQAEAAEQGGAGLGDGGKGDAVDAHRCFRPRGGDAEDRQKGWKRTPEAGDFHDPMPRFEIRKITLV